VAHKDKADRNAVEKTLSTLPVTAFEFIKEEDGTKRVVGLLTKDDVRSLRCAAIDDDWFKLIIGMAVARTGENKDIQVDAGALADVRNKAKLRHYRGLLAKQLGSEDAPDWVVYFDSSDDAIDEMGSVMGLIDPVRGENTVCTVYYKAREDQAVPVGAPFKRIANGQQVVRSKRANFTYNQWQFPSAQAARDYVDDLKGQKANLAARQASKAAIPEATKQIKRVARAVRSHLDSGKTVEQLAQAGELSASLFNDDYPASDYRILPTEIRIDGYPAQLLLSNKTLFCNVLTASCALQPSVRAIELRSEKQAQQKMSSLVSQADRTITVRELQAILVELNHLYATTGRYPSDPGASLTAAGFTTAQLADAQGRPYVLLASPAKSLQKKTVKERARYSRDRKTTVTEPYQLWAYSLQASDGMFCVGLFEPGRLTGPRTYRNKKYTWGQTTVKAAGPMSASEFEQWVAGRKATTEALAEAQKTANRDRAKANMERIAVKLVWYRGWKGYNYYARSANIKELKEAVAHRGSLVNVYEKDLTVPGRHDLEYILFKSPKGVEGIIAAEPPATRESGLWVADKDGNAHFKKLVGTEAQQAYLDVLMGRKPKATPATPKPVAKVEPKPTPTAPAPAPKTPEPTAPAPTPKTPAPAPVDTPDAPVSPPVADAKVLTGSMSGVGYGAAAEGVSKALAIESGKIAALTDAFRNAAEAKSKTKPVNKDGTITSQGSWSIDGLQLSSKTVVPKGKTTVQMDRIVLVLPKSKGGVTILVENFEIKTPAPAKCAGLAKTLEDCLKAHGFTIKMKEMDGGSMMNATIAR
jgi:hypothetical protein